MWSRCGRSLAWRESLCCNVNFGWPLRMDRALLRRGTELTLSASECLLGTEQPFSSWPKALFWWKAFGTMSKPRAMAPTPGFTLTAPMRPKQPCRQAMFPQRPSIPALSRFLVGRTAVLDPLGLAAQVAIYTNTLTGAKILNHYSTGITTNASPNYKTVVLSDGPLAYWGLDDGAYAAPGSTPVAVNSGTTGSDADGTYLAGTTPGADGPPFAGMTGGGACHFNGLSQEFDGDLLSGPCRATSISAVQAVRTERHLAPALR